MDNSTQQLEDLSAEQLSVPVCRFRNEEEQLLAAGVNDAFVEHLGCRPEGKPVADVFETLFELSEGWSDIRETVVHGGQFTVTTGPETDTRRRYVVSVNTVQEAQTGQLLFTDITDVLSDSESETAESPETDTVDATAEPAHETTAKSGLAVDHVASVVSHDLRNPLDVARARLRAGRELGEAEHFDHVEQAHDRMERIIQDVLTLARGEDVVDPDERVDLGDVARQAWETVETNGATLAVEDELPTALADPDRVSRLFENLFRNAIEHGKTEGESVTVTVGQIEAPDTDGLYVADDGPGVAPEHRAEIFKPGYSTDDHGTGLGLAIVARISELHGWDISVTSAEDGGARFEMAGVT
jgi:signal transduction histidine kinase